MSDSTFTLRVDGKRHDIDIFKKKLRVLLKDSPKLEVKYQQTLYGVNK